VFPPRCAKGVDPPSDRGRLPYLVIVRRLSRTYVAARMMAGLDQAAMALAASLSAGSVSNVERGRDARPETLRALRQPLSREGVLIGFSRNNGLASVTISFVADEEDVEA
jgi:transcriptional regulator with XRE-family HTH domain